MPRTAMVCVYKVLLQQFVALQLNFLFKVVVNIWIAIETQTSRNLSRLSFVTTEALFRYHKYT